MLAVMLAAALLGGCGGAKTGESTTTIAPASTGTTAAADWRNAVYSALTGNGGGAFDLEKWKATAAAQKLLAVMKNRYTYNDEMDPAVVAYWDALGVKKELHDAGGDKQLKWASYTPVEALAADNAAVYPVVFCYHGGYGSIYGAESYGVADKGAEERFITVCAATPGADLKGEVTGLTTGQQITGILDKLETGGYPIDRSRIYVTGMSIGGMACAWAAFEIPDVVTAIAMHSSGAALNLDAAGLGTVALSVTESDFTKAMDYGVPMFLLVGDVDMGQLPFKTEGVIGGLNLWLQMNDCATRVDLADCLAAQASGSDPAVKMVGLVGDETWTQTIDGVIHNGVDYFGTDGVKMVEIVGVENLPHFLSASLSGPGLGVLEQVLQGRPRQPSSGEVVSRARGTELEQATV